MFKKNDGNKSYTVYWEESGKYYKQHHNWWEKGGYTVPQSKKKISKAEFEKMKNAL